MNWFRNAHYHEKNKMKKDFHELIHSQLPSPLPETLSQFTVEYTLYYKNQASDPSNIVALIEKFTLDAFKEAGLIVDDSVKNHLGSSWTVEAQDKVNPRITIKLISKD